MSSNSKKAFRSILDSARSKTKSFRTIAEDSGDLLKGYYSAEGSDNILEGRYSAEALSAEISKEHDLQRQYRPLFGKANINTAPIGCHPDFIYLRGTDRKEYHHICSLFIDIKNSTRLSFLYPLETVADIKNAILKAASEVIRCLDGYVHRFMGDAVLAYFGNRRDSEEDSVVNALNCAALLESLMVGTILPVLEEDGIRGSDLGFRIGLDYGPKEKVLWASYGFNEVNEVTATSFYVDVAAKLQAMAKKNQVMLGDSIISKIDLHEDFLNVKVREQKGVPVEVGFLDRVYTDGHGNQIRYKVRELNHAAYRDLLPFPPEEKQTFSGSRSVGNPYIWFKCFTVEDERLEEYKSVSRVLPKFKKLIFSLTASKGLANGQDLPLTAKFTKRNYGQEAKNKQGSGVFPKGEHQIVLLRDIGDSPFKPADKFEFDESTEYRGLHTMECEVRDRHGVVVYRQTIGVFIE